MLTSSLLVTLTIACGGAQVGLLVDLAVARVAVQDHAAGQLVGDEAGALGVGLDQRQRRCAGRLASSSLAEEQADVAAAGDHDPLGRGLLVAEARASRAATWLVSTTE